MKAMHKCNTRSRLVTLPIHCFYVNLLRIGVCCCQHRATLFMNCVSSYFKQRTHTLSLSLQKCFIPFQTQGIRRKSFLPFFIFSYSCFLQFCFTFHFFLFFFILFIFLLVLHFLRFFPYLYPSRFLLTFFLSLSFSPYSSPFSPCPILHSFLLHLLLALQLILFPFFSSSFYSSCISSYSISVSPPYSSPSPFLPLFPSLLFPSSSTFISLLFRVVHSESQRLSGSLAP